MTWDHALNPRSKCWSSPSKSTGFLSGDTVDELPGSLLLSSSCRCCCCCWCSSSEEPAARGIGFSSAWLRSLAISSLEYQPASADSPLSMSSTLCCMYVTFFLLQQNQKVKEANLWYWISNKIKLFLGPINTHTNEYKIGEIKQYNNQKVINNK